MQFTDLYPFLISMLIGALVGTERQRRLVEAKVLGVAGLRTFTLISLLGTLSAYIAQRYDPNILVVAFGSMAVLVGFGYYAAASRARGIIDFTSAVAAVLTFALGVLCISQDSIQLAVALAVLITWVLATRKITHHYVEEISETDILDTLKMAIVALVIYPLLPDETLDPFNVLNPRRIWLMVVLVSLIGYAGYLLMRMLGTQRGLSLTGFLGGLVSSTAVTTTMASQVRSDRSLTASSAFATVIASCTMFPRMLFIVLVVNRDLVLLILPSMGLMALTGIVLAYVLLWKNNYAGPADEHKDVVLKDPFRLIPALTFGAFFAIILLASKIGSIYFGNAGAYAAGVISGLADVDAITLSMATLANTAIAPGIAATSIVLAAMTNTMVKLIIAYLLGTREFGNKVAMIFLPMIAVGILAVVLLKGLF
ncbi:MAG TPA: MgtC/SapB family protein [Methanotrichaceae archaeon]|nr:MgtC/SapB family protein [Methanotrichaceae archaeon]